ncbi:ion transporter [Companilactobacillus sp. RD055328]|uniref:ion transporter n=1 Tax=Companilactobacillus sp. RD055328 TaxID=2916634 RepID=UPI001FC84B91|nr:potassium channel family protein [Companilactobacillus sp. RD055328]GKQ42395.1 ion transporter [Companilactobacillus sp. RD055328]
MSEKKSLLYETTMIILAIISIVLIVLNYMGIIEITAEPYINISRVILLVFILDYFTRLFRSKNKKMFFKNNIIDLLAIVPFNYSFALFRVFRLLRIGKVFKIFGWGKLDNLINMTTQKIQSFMRINGLIHLLYASMGIIVVASAIYSYAEKSTLREAFWWAATTVTTVGYGDVSPSTTAGKLAAILLMFLGIGFIGMLTSSITNYFTEGTDTDKLDELLQEMQNVKKQNEQLSKQVTSLENKINKKDL